MDRADRFLRHRARIRAGKACDAEVRNLDRSVLQKHDILGLDIAVDDALVVGVLERAEDLERKVDRFFQNDAAAADEIILEGDPFDILHHDILDHVAETDVVDLNDIRMREDRDRLRFVFEPAEEFAVLGVFLLENLHGDGAVVDQIVRPVDEGHSARADQALDLVAPVDPFSQIFIVLFHR